MSGWGRGLVDSRGDWGGDGSLLDRGRGFGRRRI